MIQFGKRIGPSRACKVRTIPKYYIAHPINHQEWVKVRINGLAQCDPAGLDQYLRSLFQQRDGSPTNPSDSIPIFYNRDEEEPFEVPVITPDEISPLGPGHWSNIFHTKDEAILAAWDSGAAGAVWVVENEDGEYELWFSDNTI